MYRYWVKAELRVWRWFALQYVVRSLCLSLGLFLALLLLAEPGEGAVRVGHQLLWRVVLDQLALAEQQDTVRGYDRVKPVSDSQHGGFDELFIEKPLDGFLSDDIDIGRRFIEHDKPASAQDGSDDAEQLALTHGQVLALLLDLVAEATGVV